MLKKYIKFFWELHIDYMHLDHRIITQRNINIRFNLNETPQYLTLNGKSNLLENVFFSGIQNRYMDAHIRLNGRVDMLGICFFSYGFYPFLNIPVSEFTNQFLGADEVGFKPARTISERLKGAADVSSRLDLLENELVLLLYKSKETPESFIQLFDTIKQSSTSRHIYESCKRNNICVRTLERMYNKYVGVSAMTFLTLSRFQSGLYKLINNDYSKLSDIAYGSGYFDQMHFIKEFKRFAGNTPN
ncbi:MAG: DUF6597 domain-containing transcriptional factor, partial [Syntrophothermus sp.]